jgi:tetratricopeptide (TPR) repeat protein
VTFDGARYAIDPLATAVIGADTAAHEPHYRYYEALAREHDKRQDYAGLDVESDNLEAAFEWALAAARDADADWLYNACSFFLANRGRFDQRRDWLERVAPKLADHPDESLRANAQISLGILYQGHPTGDRRANLKRSIAAYEAALEYRTPQAAPLDYATTQNNLGTAYCNLSEIEDRAGHLRRAITAYEAALVYRTPQATPLAYARTQHNLGIALEDSGDLPAAVARWREAERYYRQMGMIDRADLMQRWITEAEGGGSGGDSGAAKE